MIGVLTDAVDFAMLSNYVRSVMGQVQLRLFANDVSPAKSDAATAYTEVAGGGYAAIPLDPGAWSLAQGPPPQASYGQRTWSFNAQVGLVYGYYMTDGTGALVGAERFRNGPYDVKRDGDKIKVTPVIAMPPYGG